MQDGYKLNRRAGAKMDRKNPGIPAAGAERIPGMRFWGLLGAQGFDGVALGCAAGRDDAGQNGEQGSQCHEEEGCVYGQGSNEGRSAGDFLDDDVSGDEQYLARRMPISFRRSRTLI